MTDLLSINTIHYSGVKDLYFFFLGKTANVTSSDSLIFSKNDMLN